jgi:hypothetical protein
MRAAPMMRFDHEVGLGGRLIFLQHNKFCRARNADRLSEVQVNDTSRDKSRVWRVPRGLDLMGARLRR